GQTDAAIGAAGVAPLRDYRGTADTFGVPLEGTVAAVADEIAAAADLVMGKAAGVPVGAGGGVAGPGHRADGPRGPRPGPGSCRRHVRVRLGRCAQRPPDGAGVHR